MKIVVLALAVAASFTMTVLPAAAACPLGTTYNCTQMPNGKMSCGCR